MEAAQKERIAEQPPHETQSLTQLLTTPWVDKFIAVVAVLPFAYPIVLHFRALGLNTPDVVYVMHATVMVATMLLRRTPVRVTLNPSFWLLSFVGTYWSFLTLSIEQAGRLLAPKWLSDSIVVGSLSIMILARLHLGRNVGILPAQREIVGRGLYRFVRHPMYTSFFVLFLGLGLSHYSPRNLLLYFLGAFWVALRTFAEESFLREDSQYAAYMQRVRWRWFPGLV